MCNSAKPNLVSVSRQTAELTKLRQDCGRLVSELNEKTGKLQQEGVQKKNAEQAAAQLKVTPPSSLCHLSVLLMSSFMT